MKTLKTSSWPQLRAAISEKQLPYQTLLRATSMPNNDFFKQSENWVTPFDIFRVIKPVYVSKANRASIWSLQNHSSFEGLGIEVKTFSFIRHYRNILLNFL